jgi:hypothetical protein
MVRASYEIPIDSRVVVDGQQTTLTRELLDYVQLPSHNFEEAIKFTAVLSHY